MYTFSSYMKAFRLGFLVETTKIHSHSDTPSLKLLIGHFPTWRILKDYLEHNKAVDGHLSSDDARV